MVVGASCSPFYTRFHIPFKTVATRLAITKLNIKLEFDFSTNYRQDDGLLGFVP
jgi:hypothetical protein